MQIFGSFDEWVIRLPGQVSFVLTAVAVYLFCKESLGKPTALTAAFFLLTGGEVLFYGLTIAGQIDLFYMLIVFLHIACLYAGLRSGNRWQWILLSYLFLSLGVLTKGLPSFAFHGLTLIAWAIYTRSLRWIWHWSQLGGGILTLLLVGGFFYGYHVQGGDAWIYVINLFKEASIKSGLEASIGKVLINALNFPFSFLKIMLPWSLLLGILVFKRCRNGVLSGSADVTFVLVFLALNVLPYWFAGHLSLRYLYPFLPFMAIVLAYLATKHIHWSVNLRFFDYFIFGLIGLATIGFIAARLAPSYTGIDYYAWKLFFVIMMSIGLGVVWWHVPSKRIATSILLMAMLKLCSNWIYYPIRYADEQSYSLEMEVDRFFEYTQGAPVMLFGHPEVFVSDASIGPLTFDEVVFEGPMPLSYQHPYYIEKRQGQIMEFHTEMRPGTYYLARADDVKDKNIQILYSFIDDWQRRPLVLCTLR